MQFHHMQKYFLDIFNILGMVRFRSLCGTKKLPFRKYMENDDKSFNIC